MRSATRLAFVSVSITVLLVATAVSAADNPNVTKTEVLAGTAANSGTMMSHADAALTRLVVVDSEQRLVLSYAVDSSGQLRLRDRVGLGEGELPERATQIERYTPPSSDVPGDDPPGIERISGKRVSVAFGVDDRGERWEAEYLVTGAPVNVYRSIVETLGKWKITSRRFAQDRAGGAYGDLIASRNGYELRLRVAPNGNETWGSLVKVIETHPPTP